MAPVTGCPGIAMDKKTIHRTLVPSNLGKLPPQATDLEAALLGAIMLERDTIQLVLDILDPEDFYEEAHKSIFRSVVLLFSNSQPVDILTVTQTLRKQGKLEQVGGAHYVTELTTLVNSAANSEYHARLIKEQAMKRALIRMCSSTETGAYDEREDVFVLMERLQNDLFRIAGTFHRRQAQRLSTALIDYTRELQARGKNARALTGVPSGYTALDRATGGWQKTDLIIIAARPAMGKTAFVLNCLRNAALMEMGVAMFSLEMSLLQLTGRLVSIETEIETGILRRGGLTDEQWSHYHAKTSRLHHLPVWIDDTPELSILALKTKARKLVAEGANLIIVDYLQLMAADKGSNNRNREQEIGAISRSLKGIAKELNVPVIALAQLSRAVESRGGSKRPQLSDLRDSGSIEQDADVVCFLHRPEYYGITEDEHGQSTANMAELIIAKHRNGSLEDIPLRFYGRYQQFHDYDSTHHQSPAGDLPVTTDLGAMETDYNATN